jgi:peroxiredoxin Q/BCP
MAKKKMKKSAAKKTAKKSAKKAAKKAAPRAAKKMKTKAKPKASAKKSVAKKSVAKKTAAKKLAPKKNTATTLASTSSVLQTGSKAPGFELPSDTGNTISLKDYAGQKVVLYFYPKDDTPGCTQESCDFRDSFTRVQAAGAVVLGVSKDSVESHQKFKTKFSLPFPLLSDVSGKMLEAYQVWKEKSMYGKTFMGIDRTTFLIDVDASGNGTIRKVYSKVKVAGHVDEILSDLAQKV